MVSHGGRGETSNNSGDRQVGVLKKGPWTAAEDAVLLEYVKRQGEGNWNAVQKNSGLQRCGKSCRLRWANHLRPFLKKGPFTPDEEKTILDLHSKIGNKWARMAAQLPGRTDNEIKNYWNTRLKRRQRANLPIYPVDLLQHQYNHNHNQQQPPISQVYPSSSFASIISATGAASSSNNQTHLRRGQNQNFIPLDLLNHGNNIMSPTNSFSYLPRVNNNNGLFSNHAFSFQNAPLYQKPLSFDFGIGLNTGAEPISTTTNNNNTRTTSFGQLGLFSMATGNTELSSIQNRTPIMTVQTSNSGYTGSDELMGGVSSGGDEEYDIKRIERCNSGLLGDLLEESQAIKRGDNSSREKESFDDYKTPLIKPKLELFGGVSLSAHSNNEVKERTEEVGEEMNIMDDDLLRLLECPSPVCIPDWYEIGSSTNTSNYNSSTEPSNVTTTTDMIRNPKKEEDDGDDWDENFCCWNNMPRVLS